MTVRLSTEMDALYSLWHGLHAFTAGSRSTQLYTLQGFVKWLSALIGWVIINSNGGCSWQLAWSNSLQSLALSWLDVGQYAIPALPQSVRGHTASSFVWNRRTVWFMADLGHNACTIIQNLWNNAITGAWFALALTTWQWLAKPDF